MPAPVPRSRLIALASTSICPAHPLTIFAEGASRERGSDGLAPGPLGSPEQWAERDLADHGTDPVSLWFQLGENHFDIVGISGELKPMMEATLIAHADGQSIEIPVKVRLDTPAEVEYYNAGGILPYVLDQILS